MMSEPQTYEHLEFARFRLGRAIPEAFEGTKIVAWQGDIERQLGVLLKDAESSRNWDYADKLRKYLEIWRGNEITGSLNRETLETLRAATEILAVDSWTLSSYFAPLRDRLRVLIASEEQLPRGIDMDQNDAMMGGPSGRGAPPMSPSFGPEKEKPPGLETPGSEKPGEGAAPGTPEAGAPGVELPEEDKPENVLV